MNTDLVWFKSSYSGPNGGDCVEVAVAGDTDTVHVRDSKGIRGPEVRVSGAPWRAFIAYVAGDDAWHRSSYSGTNGGDCVEVAVRGGSDVVRVRDSKAVGGPEVRVSGASWRAFIAYAKAEQAG